MELANNTGSEVNLNYRDLCYMQRICKVIGDTELYDGIIEGHEHLELFDTDVIPFDTETILSSLYKASRTHVAIRWTHFVSARHASGVADRLVHERVRDIPTYN